jgi:hypothetical protein
MMPINKLSSISVNIHFFINARTVFGEIIGIVGNCNELGNWDPNLAKPLQTDLVSYPMWKGSFSLPKNIHLEYKYILISKNNLKNSYQWESFKENRNILVKGTEMSIWDGEFDNDENQKILWTKQELKRITENEKKNESTISDFEKEINNLKQLLQSEKQAKEELEKQLQQKNDLIRQLEGCQLESLSLKELKRLEKKSRESSNLINKILLQRMSQELKKINRETECVVCMDAKADTICLPCKHLVMCSHCSERINKNVLEKDRRCPTCRNFIKQQITVFVK